MPLRSNFVKVAGPSWVMSRRTNLTMAVSHITRCFQPMQKAARMKSGVGNITESTYPKKVAVLTAKGTVSESQKREVEEYNLLGF
jgi:hypothetical protein